MEASDGLLASDLVAGKIPQDLHSAGLLVGPYQLHILLFAKGGWGQPWAAPTGVRVLGRFAPLETLREICPMYLGLDRRHLGPYHYQEKGFRYPIDEHDLRPGRHDQTGSTCHLTCQGQCENLRQNRGVVPGAIFVPPIQPLTCEAIGREERWMSVSAG